MPNRADLRFGARSKQSKIGQNRVQTSQKIQKPTAGGPQRPPERTAAAVGACGDGEGPPARTAAAVGAYGKGEQPVFRTWALSGPWDPSESITLASHTFLAKNMALGGHFDPGFM